MNPAAQRILTSLARHATFADLTNDNLGYQLVELSERFIRANIAAQCAPDGTPWPELSDKYAEWKEFHYPGQPMGILHYVMAYPDEVRGMVHVSATQAEMTYGLSEQARDEAEWFQEGDPAKNRPPRRFWGFSDAMTQAVTDLLSDRFKKIV